MVTKEDLLDYINNNYYETIYNIHLFKKSITNELINLFNNISNNSNNLQHNSQKYFIESIIDEISEKYKSFTLEKIN